MFMFGVVMICQGLVTNWGGLMTTRFFLGVFESGMFPGCEFVLEGAGRPIEVLMNDRLLPDGHVVQAQ